MKISSEKCKPADSRRSHKKKGHTTTLDPEDLKVV
jgi:hypothetical protein